MGPVEIAKATVSIAAGKKAKRMVVMDLREISDICDIQIVCSGDSDRQTKAIATAIEDDLKANFNIRPVAVEGRTSGQWVLLDYGPVMVHIFYEPIRDYYALEELWPTAKFLEAKDFEG